MMSDLFTIRIAELPADWPYIQAIRRQVFHEEQGIDLRLDFDGKDEVAQHWLVWCRGAAIGTTRVRCLDSATAKLERLAVLPEFRGRGLGQQLIQQALTALQFQGIARVTLHAQTPLQHFYERLGFEAEGDRFEEAGKSHVKMRKHLRSHPKNP